jgi:hypothetical protein
MRTPPAADSTPRSGDKLHSSVFVPRMQISLELTTSTGSSVVLAWILNGDKIVGFKNRFPHFYP